MGIKKEILCTVLSAAAGVLLGVLAIADASDKSEAQLQQEEYCAMVKLNQTTSGELGWPDYRKQYKELCE